MEEKIEKPEDVGKGDAGTVTFWKNELEMAGKAEDEWRKYAQHCIDVYEGETQKRFANSDTKPRGNEFNILWSNTETLKPALYNSTPRPDIRRRFRDKDPVGRAGAEVLERGASYCIDSYDFDQVVKDAILDYLLAGRGVARIRYIPTFMKVADKDGQPQPDQVGYEEAPTELVHWDKLRIGYARTWSDVPWVAFELELTRDQLAKMAPDVGHKVELDIEPKAESDAAKADQFKRGRVWEIWHKDKRQVLFIAPSFPDKPLKVLDDPLKLRDFFPIPRPLYSVQKTGSMLPTAEYSLYEAQAEELDRITKRINRIIAALKVRGIYDSAVKEMASLFDADDNAFIAATDVAQLRNEGGIEKSVWMLPIDKIIVVLRELVTQRETIKGVIYEITGIADIIRGASDPNETLGAQEIKQNWAGLRLNDRQKEVQRFVRDLIRLKVEIIAERFSPTTLRIMSGLDLPTEADKKKAQLVVMQSQQMQQPAPPEATQVLARPSWEQVISVIRNDASRNYRIDIETDSTIQGANQDDQKQVAELMDAMAKFMQAMLPAVQSQMMPMEAAKAMMLSVVRRFKLGREVEDEIDKMGGQPVQSDEMQKARQELEAKAQELEQANRDLQNEKMGLSQQRLDYERDYNAKDTDLLQRELKLSFGEETLKLKQASSAQKPSAGAN